MFYYAIKQSLINDYEEKVIVNSTFIQSSMVIIYEQLNNFSDDQYTYKVYRLNKNDYETLKACSNHTGERQTMLGNFIDRGSVLTDSHILLPSIE
jgi:hypothetical protein